MPSRFISVACRSCTLTGSLDRKSTRLNSSHVRISYAVFCLKKKKGSRWRRGPFDAARTTSGCGDFGHSDAPNGWLSPLPRSFFFHGTATTEIYTLSLHDALPISKASLLVRGRVRRRGCAHDVPQLRRRFRNRQRRKDALAAGRRLAASSPRSEFS